MTARGSATVVRHQPSLWSAGPVSGVLQLLVLAYQGAIAPLLGPRCRFHPSCSNYALAALRSHGSLRGSWLAARRLLRCQPLSAGGLDPVPPGPRSQL